MLKPRSFVTEKKTYQQLCSTGEAELMLRVFENTELRRTFGPKRDEVREEWRKLNKEELNNLYSPSNIFWVIKWR